jgi:hypothetical protein
MASEKTDILSGLLGELSRFVAIALAFVYAIGVIVVHASLARFGLETGLDLAHPQYVLVGALWTFLVGSTLAFVRAFTIPPGMHFPKSLQRAATLGLKLCASALLPLLLLIVLVGFEVAFSPRGLAALAAIAFNVLVVGVFLWLIAFVRMPTSSRQVGKLLSEPEIYIPLIGAIFVFWFGALGLYARYGYRILPPELGGGRHGLVIVRLKQPISLSGRVPLEMEGSQKQFGPVELLLETDKTIIVPLYAERNQEWLKPSVSAAFVINKDSIEYMLYIPKPRGRNLDAFLNDKGPKANQVSQPK